MTEQEIRLDYARKFGRPMSNEDYHSFLRLAYAFNCLDAKSFEDAYEKILVSLESVSAELETTDSFMERYKIVMRRYGTRLLEVT